MPQGERAEEESVSKPIQQGQSVANGGSSDGLSNRTLSRALGSQLFRHPTGSTKARPSEPARPVSSCPHGNDPEHRKVAAELTRLFEGRLGPALQQAAGNRAIARMVDRERASSERERALTPHHVLNRDPADGSLTHRSDDGAGDREQTPGTPVDCPKAAPPPQWNDPPEVPSRIMAKNLQDAIDQLNTKLGKAHTTTSIRYTPCFDDVTKKMSIFVIKVATRIYRYEFAPTGLPEDDAALTEVAKTMAKHEHTHRDISHRVLKGLEKAMDKAKSQEEADKILAQWQKKLNDAQTALDRKEGGTNIHRDAAGKWHVEQVGRDVTYVGEGADDFDDPTQTVFKGQVPP